MGGIGKTTLAQVYLTQYYEQYQHIAWIRLGEDTVEHSFINAEGLLEQLQINKADQSASGLFRAVLLALRALPNGPCLLVLDNAEATLAKYRDALPNQPPWHLQVTSREKIPFFEHKT